MRVSCLVTMPARETLRSSAAAAFAAEPSGLAIDAVTDRAGFVLDRTFPALPIAGTHAGDVAFEAAAPGQAPVFVARGTVETNRLDELGDRQSDFGVFADPEIGTFIVCPNNAPVGGTADVERKLDTAGLLAKGLDGKGAALAIMDTGVNLAHLKSRGLKPESPSDNVRQGLSGRNGGDSRRVLKPHLDVPCGPRPLAGSITVRAFDTKPT
ncbi:hypothetical protein Y590_19350 [Methylobacterium sp. AMS5]|nr:hypothetical protein Y590_19350 [Methylobacterium sp. AMS5]